MLVLFSIIIIPCLGILVYFNTLFVPFQFDDIPYIVDNPFIRNIHHLQDIWRFCPCRFVAFFSIAFNYHYHQLNVFHYHLFNLTVHLISAMLVWWLTLLTLSTPALKGDKITAHAKLVALLVGLVFISHPIQTEAVTYIWQRAASMGALFYLASLCFYVKARLYICTGGHKVRLYYILSLMMVILAMFTKETAITLPLVILLYELCFLNVGEELVSSRWRDLSPFLLTLFIIPLTMLLTKSARFQEIQRVVQGPEGISPIHYLLTQFRVMITYIRLAFLPFNQNLDYDYPIYKSIFEWPVLISFLFLAGILFGAKQLFSKYRLVAFSIFWFFLTLLPESSFLPLQDVIFEHRLYLPLVGFSLFLVSCAYYLFGKNSLKLIVIILLILIAGYSVLTYQRNKVWRDESTLWGDTVAKSLHKARPFNNRGLAYFHQGNFLKAISDYNKAIEINPHYAEAYNNRGLILAQKGYSPEAVLDFNKAIEINPKYADAYNNRGIVYAIQGDFNQAISNLSQAIKINSNDAEAYCNRGSAYYGEGNITQASSDYNRANEINPNSCRGQQ